MVELSAVYPLQFNPDVFPLKQSIELILFCMREKASEFEQLVKPVSISQLVSSPLDIRTTIV